MYQFKIGAIDVIKISESLSPAVEPFTFLDGLPPDAIERNLSWLRPVLYDGRERKLILSGHAWLLRTPRQVILLEACAGNHKPRPGFPRGHMLNTRWLERLAEAGVQPKDVDVILCTHLHVDHVGWFTTRENESWVPTFPEARYLVDALEYDNWNPKTRTLPPFPLNENVFEDSIAPVMGAGLMTLVTPPYEVEPGVRIVPARGHTLGHVAVKVENGNDSALFVGDAMHTPLQIIHPECPTYGCEDKAAAIDTHRRLLAECADQRRLFVPTHFPEPYSAVRILRTDDGFAFTTIDGEMPQGLRETLNTRRR